jgi:hypothetical protein
MTGPVRRVYGWPDLSGIWQAQAEPRGPGLYGLGESPNSNFSETFWRISSPARSRFSWRARNLRQHSQPGAIRNPGLNCLPYGVPHADLLSQPFKLFRRTRKLSCCTKWRPPSARSSSMDASKSPIRSIKFVEELLPDTDLLEHYCLENEKDAGTNRARPATERCDPARVRMLSVSNFTCPLRSDECELQKI